jgi:hypothetical protein
MNRLALATIGLGILAAAVIAGWSLRADDSTDAATNTTQATASDSSLSVPSALDNMRHPNFPAPLVDIDRILSGGPPPDGIPAIDDPQFDIAEEVDWLSDVEPVVVLELDGEARAYPVQILTWHEIVNDTVGATPVAVSYCPLCNSALAFDRRLDAQVLDFGTSGRLYNSSLVMYDRQTESLWTHFDGRAVVGTLTGSTLEGVSVQMASWATFRDAHPTALVLNRNTGFVRDYGRNPYPGYDDVNTVPFLFDGDLDGRLAAQTRVVSIRGESESIAISLDELATIGSISTTIDNQPIVVLHLPGTSSALDASTIADGRDVGTTGVFDARWEGHTLELEPQADGTFVDEATGQAFDILGRNLTNPDAAGLVPVEHLDTFWFAIAAFEPDTRIVDLKNRSVRQQARLDGA